MRRSITTNPENITLEDIKSRTVKNENGCWEWVYPDGSIYRDRYPAIKGNRVSRIVLRLIGQKLEDRKLYACHKCDNKACVNPDHLFIGTSRDNQIDLWKKVRAGKTVRNKRWNLRDKYVERPEWVSVDT